MRLRLLAALAPFLVSSSLLAQIAPVQPVSEAALKRHIDILASDAFVGRQPGTAGETKTLEYLVKQFAALGMVPAGENGTWYQPVPLVSRAAFAHRALFSRGGQPMDFAQADVVLLGRQPVERLADAPVWLVGEDLASGMAGANLKGAVVLLPQTPAVGRDFEKIAAALAGAGAGAVIVVLGAETPWEQVSAATRRGRDRLQRDGEAAPAISGIMPRSAALRLADEARLDAAAKPGFRAVQLPVRASLDVSTQVRAYKSHNVIGRLAGRGRTGEAIMYLGHWDHLGVCRPEGAADRICNGAVDNASGLAMMIETARALSRNRPERDILFMGTTAEEMGLLGAEWFGTRPTVPLSTLIAAINIDTVAIAPAGEPVAIVGRGTTPLDSIVDRTARELGRQVDADLEANAFTQRQDGYALTKAGVPTVMVGGSFADMGKLGAFLSGPYHKPEDDLQRPIELGGAAEDTMLMVALGRKLADPREYRAQSR